LRKLRYFSLGQAHVGRLSSFRSVLERKKKIQIRSASGNSSALTSVFALCAVERLSALYDLLDLLVAPKGAPQFDFCTGGERLIGAYRDVAPDDLASREHAVRRKDVEPVAVEFRWQGRAPAEGLSASDVFDSGLEAATRQSEQQGQTKQASGPSRPTAFAHADHIGIRYARISARSKLGRELGDGIPFTSDGGAPQCVS
jgi:hypothetical protein